MPSSLLLGAPVFEQFGKYISEFTEMICNHSFLKLNFFSSNQMEDCMQQLVFFDEGLGKTSHFSCAERIKNNR